MSKFVLQKQTLDACGISVEESQRALNLSPNLFHRLGGTDGWELLSTLFYDRVFADKSNPWFLNIFASSSKAEAIENQYRFFVQTFGGPDLYRQKKGKYTRLVGRHANYPIGHRAADRWVFHMNAALEEHPKLVDDDEALGALKDYFLYTAHYIVVASQFMRPDQLSGGTQIDAGRVW
mmetsp:Transcript_11065/g.31807  ORF Transcript_11065/g.31807 Transcript_11065/m.31807 type:complete len:178 (-) Transcript_11065:162-695(-)|eukprot:CAMPEP_0119570908 /NCGR_PEP_ID=MMETSP1352-20130426/43853_1 /TAXON_ID=265584 /ORGANISM="Stauroneis constricta, Strain CCMP1120" /LENGTH=177 /DNA_ID=CAMNT_0007620585 /DNA_START=734 /DNA_END=1264 /DNA_ORIENTATION=-